MDSAEAAMRGSKRLACKVLCVSCKQVIRAPIQLCCCGVRICETCETGTCPIEQCKASNQERFRDKAFEKDCCGKDLCCPICCIWSGSVEGFQAHLDSFHDRAEVDCILIEGLAQEYMEAPASPMEIGSLSDSSTDGTSVESYNRNDQEKAPNSFGLVAESFIAVPSRVVNEEHVYVSDLIHCGSCGAHVSLDKMYVHQVKCYCLTEYKDTCYPLMNVMFEESGFPYLGSNEMIIEHTSVPIHPPFVCALENTILRNICVQTAENIKAYHDKMVQQAKVLCKKSAPIEYPDCTGKIKWRVSEVSRRSCDIDHSSICSPSFYASGYGMRLKLDFEREQNCLQLMIQSGENDNELLWPFRGRFDIGLLNFGLGDGIFERSRICEAPRCFTENGGNIVGSVMLPSFSNDFVYGDGVYINCYVEAQGP